MNKLDVATRLTSNIVMCKVAIDQHRHIAGKQDQIPNLYSSHPGDKLTSLASPHTSQKKSSPSLRPIEYLDLWFIKSLPWPIELHGAKISFYRNIFLSQYCVSKCLV